MKKSILIFTFFFFLGATIYAQDNDPKVEEDIILTTKSTQGQGLPVVTDIIFIDADEIVVLDLNLSTIDGEKYIPAAQFIHRETSVIDNNSDLVGSVQLIEEKANQRLEGGDNCSEAMVYPNPAKFFTNLVLPTRKTYDVYLLDMLGNQRMSWTFSNTLKERLDLVEFQTGIYFIQLVCGAETKTLRLKIVK